MVYMYIISYFNMPPLFYAVGASGIVDDYVVRNFAMQNYNKKMTYARSTSFFSYFSALMQQNSVVYYCRRLPVSFRLPSWRYFLPCGLPLESYHGRIRMWSVCPAGTSIG